MAQGWRRNTVLQGSGRMRQLITQVSKPRANGKQRPVPNVPLPSAMLRLLKVPQSSQTEPPAEDQEIKPTSLWGNMSHLNLSREDPLSSDCPRNSIHSTLDPVCRLLCLGVPCPVPKLYRIKWSIPSSSPNSCRPIVLSSSPSSLTWVKSFSSRSPGFFLSHKSRC